MKQYLTSQGLQTLWNQIKALFATKAELNQKANKTELNTLSESVSASLSEIEQTDIRQDASISSLSENKADKTALNKLSTDTAAALDKKVDKVSGMGLSHNDYTDEDKAKLDGIEANANNYSLPIAGSELGGVKNGGVVTIQSDGTMQVKDDSHNHIISNVNGLQEALDKKRNGDLGFVTLTDEFDWNAWTKAGAYTTNCANGAIGLNAPTPKAYGYGIMIIEYSDNVLLQLYYPHHGDCFYRRIRYGSSNWDAWQLFRSQNFIDENYATKTENDSKVDKVEGKGLSTNDYTTAEKDKLAGVAAGAEVNTIVAVQRNGTAITPANRVVNILVPVKTSELNNDSTYQTAADVAETIVGVKLDLASGIITLTRKNGTTFTLDLPTEKIIKSGRYDSETEEIVLVLEDESEIRFSASELIDEYYADESTLELYTDTADGNKKKFRIKTAYKNKIDGSEQTTNKTASVSASSTDTQYPNAKAVYNAVKDLATKVQTFTQASTRANIESGETISTIFGKIRKWFSDLKAVAFSGSYNDLSDKPSIGNGTIIIKQKGVEKGSFTMNQTGNATIELTDTTYGIATSASAGMVKSGGDITVDASGNVSVNNAAKATADDSGNNIEDTYFKKNQYSFTKSYSINGSGWYLIGYLQTRTENPGSYRSGTITLTMYSLITQEFPHRAGTLTYAISANYSNPQIRISDSLLPFLTTRWDNVTKRVEIWGYGEKTYSGFRLVFDSAAVADYFVLNPDTITELKDAVEGEPIYQFKTCLELTDSNLATYFANGVLTIQNGVTTVIFNTTAVKTVYLVQGTVQTNGYRLTIGGKWQPDTNSDYQGLEGCFPYYVDYHYLGHTGSSLPNIDAYSHFADYVYFNGMWFSKMY